MDFLSGLWNWVTGSSVASSLAKTALLGYASKLINQNVNQSNTSSTTVVVDKGVRLQLKADSQNKIPVLYGEAYFGGNLTDARISTDYKKMTYCLTLAEVVGNKFSTNGSTSYTFVGVYLNNNKVFFKSDGVTVNYTVDSAGNQDNSLSGLVKIYFYKGSTGIQPEGYSGSTPAANTIMTAWGSNFPMTNLLYAIVEVTYNKDKNVTGLPDCQFHIKNDMVLPGDVLVDYMMNTRYGAGIASTEIDGTSMTALNTYCNTGFSYQTSGGVTQTSIIDINGLIDTNTAVMTNMEEMAKAANSWISYNIHAGLWRVVINQPGTAVATLDDSNIVGEIAVSGTSLTQLNNSVDVKYQNKNIKDKTDYVKINIPSGELYQNEPGSTLQLSLPFTNSQAVALRVGIQTLKQNRIDKVITFTSDYSYINITAGDIINVTSDIYGFSSKSFRVITVEETEGDGGDIQVKFTCLEYSASVYTGDIAEYSIETNDGLFTIGAIGKPSTPTIAKTEKANVPRITVTGTSPSGVVEVLEYWITFDTDIVNDADRTYQQFSSFRNKDGSLLTESQSCVIRYSQLNAGEFYIKTRGANSIISGPFSDPSAKVTYNPVVVADTVSNNPTTDSNGNLMSFGLLGLLTLLNDLMNGVTGAGSLFDAISNLFAGSAPGTGKPKLAIKDEGTGITTETSSINFVGSCITATASGTDVTVTVDCGGGTTPTSPEVCEITGLSAGSITKSAPVKTYDNSCIAKRKWSVYPSSVNHILTASTTSAPVKTGTGPWFVKYTLPSGTAPTTNIYYDVDAGNENMGDYTTSTFSYNGSFLCTASTTTSITLKYPYNPGTWTIPSSNPTFTYKTSDTKGNIVHDPFKPLSISNSTYASYTLSVTCNQGEISLSNYGNFGLTSVSGYKKSASASSEYYGNASIPIVVQGSYDSVNYVLQSGLSYATYTSVIPPANTNLVITYSLTPQGGTATTHTETFEYVSIATYDPTYKSV